MSGINGDIGNDERRRRHMEYEAKREQFNIPVPKGIEIAQQNVLLNLRYQYTEGLRALERAQSNLTAVGSKQARKAYEILWRKTKATAEELAKVAGHPVSMPAFIADTTMPEITVASEDWLDTTVAKHGIHVNYSGSYGK